MKESWASLEMRVEGQTHFRAASELLDTRQYERAAEILQQAQITSKQTGNGILVRILDAARRICLACNQYQIEVESHQQACKEAKQREHELRQQLYAILDLISTHDSPEAPKKRERLPNPLAVETSLLEYLSPERVGRPSLWQRIQRLLGWGPGSWSSEQELHTGYVEQLAHSSFEQAETATTFSVRRAQQKEQGSPTLIIYCLGPFRVYQDDQPVENWPSNKGKAIFKYLITHRTRPIVKDVLMELFWPGAHPDAARNNLNVAIYGLRQALRQDRPSFSHVLFQDDCYLLNPDLQIWVDCEAFMEHLSAARALEQRGELVAAAREYCMAEALYQGEFLEEDRYEDWLVPQRQGLQDDYLSLLDCLSRYYFDRDDYAACTTMCNKMLTVDACCEEAHRRLMRCYSRQGQHYLALRQYHQCVETLEEELQVTPTSGMSELYERIRRHQQV